MYNETLLSVGLFAEHRCIGGFNENRTVLLTRLNYQTFNAKARKKNMPTHYSIRHGNRIVYLKFLNSRLSAAAK